MCGLTCCSTQGAAAAAAAAARTRTAEGAPTASRLAEGMARLLERAWDTHLRQPPHGLPGEGFKISAK